MTTMKTRTMFMLGLSAIAMTAVAGASVPAVFAGASAAENAKQGTLNAAKAQKALAKRNADQAVKFAEAAVAFAPRDAEYRALLGQAYLLAGRFASAKQALSDSLSLQPDNPRVALNLALAQIAQGEWASARQTLDENGSIGISDRGLAYALAGDPAKAVELLAPAAREADATAKTRQNLALSLALAGRWGEAKLVASVDLPPDQVEARILQWAAFARPTNAYDQVASLLNVRPIADSGLPAQLALADAPNTAVAAAEPAAVDAYMPSAPAATEVAAAQEGDTTVAAAPAVEVAGTNSQIVFGPRAEIVQAIPASSAVEAAPAPARKASPAPARAVASATPAKGKFFVQLGAYANAGVARDKWRQASARVPAIAKFSPQGANVSTKAGSFYRLSVGGFARADADSLCRQVKASGGNCFVRVQAGDQVASWARGGTQLASR